MCDLQLSIDVHWTLIIHLCKLHLDLCVGFPREEAITKRRRTAARGRDFIVKIEFAGKIRMKAIHGILKRVMGMGDLEQEVRAIDALRVLDIVLRESASRR